MSDPFADLWSSSTSASTDADNSAAMTIAAKMAMDARTKAVLLPTQRIPNTTKVHDDSAWAGLDTLAAPAPAATIQANSIQSEGMDPFDLPDSDFDFGNRTLAAPAPAPTLQAKSIQLEGMHHFNLPDSDFDCGNREDGLLVDFVDSDGGPSSSTSRIGVSVPSKPTAFWKEGKAHDDSAWAGLDTLAAPAPAPTIQANSIQSEGMDHFDLPDSDFDFGNREDDFGDSDGGPSSSISRIGVSVLSKATALWKEGKEKVAKIYEDRSAPASSRTSTPPSRRARPPASSTTRKSGRPLPTASTTILTMVNKHRTAGTSQFKLGQYAVAVESYSAAIDSLPPGHLLLVPLFNNRALARIRIGDYKRAAEDAGGALAVILTADSDGEKVKEEEAAWNHPRGLGVDLVKGYVKALRRRAEANEGMERWEGALKDWEVLSAPTPQDGVAGGGWLKEPVRQEAQRGAARCRKILATVNQGSSDLMATTASKPKPNPPPVSRRKPAISASTQLPPSAPLRSLQAATAQAEADENLKFQLKDAVDAKLLAWRARKETNIRALLASLDMVLWEEILTGVKVGGLHELVTPGQVKKGYMKAIGRVHPDKLNAQNSTVEQRMLGNGVFGTLNEAWIAFQSSNGM